MAGNPFRGQIEIELKGRTCRLKFDNNTIANIEQDLDISLFDTLTSDEKVARKTLLSIRFLRSAIYHGMKAHGCSAKLTPTVVGEYMDASPAVIAGYAKKIMSGIMAWWGKDLDVEIAADPLSEESDDPKAQTQSSTPADEPAGGSTSLQQEKPESGQTVSGA